MSHVIERVTNHQMPTDNMVPGMTTVRIWALAAIAREGTQGKAIWMADSATEPGITPRSATAVVDGLEHLGLVTREADDKDRRTVRVWLTDQALGLLPSMGAAWDA